MEQALFLDLLFIASAEVHLKSLEAQAPALRRDLNEKLVQLQIGQWGIVSYLVIASTRLRVLKWARNLMQQARCGTK